MNNPRPAMSAASVRPNVGDLALIDPDLFTGRKVEQVGRIVGFHSSGWPIAQLADGSRLLLNTADSFDPRGRLRIPANSRF